MVKALRYAIVIAADTVLFVVFIIILLFDKLVNETLYSYGLQFNSDWYFLYKTYFSVGLVLVAVAIFLISLALLPILMTKEKSRT